MRDYSDPDAAPRDIFGLSYGCPVFSGLDAYNVVHVAGSSLSAAEVLVQAK